MSEAISLISDDRPSRVFAWTINGPITTGQALSEIEALARELATGEAYLNLCTDRYLFTLTFAAICLAGGTNLLPSNHNDSAMADVRRQFPGAAVLDDEIVREAFARAVVEPVHSPTSPTVPGEQCCAVVFTSGSTGQPTGHRKSWRELYEIAQALESRLFGHDDGYNIVATVPPQHMYGLETSVLPVLHSGCAANTRVPFLPWEISEALDEIPGPRALVTTPMHLRACLSSDTRFPSVDMMVSATAPLPPQAARDAETVWGAPMCEIYGCTEAGSLATRRPIETETWTLLNGLELAQEASSEVRGGRLSATVRLEDRLEVFDSQHFRLLGRSQDMLKLGGKRMSLADLSHRLQSIEGVDDAVAFVPEAARSDSESRPAALVVAPEVSESTIRAHLAALIDPVFVPRPLVRVDRLPRNAMGKLPHAELEAKLRSVGRISQ